MKIKAIVLEHAQHLPLPKRQTSGSIGFDLRCASLKEICLLPDERRLVPTGIAFDLSETEMGAFLFIRSGLSQKRVCLANGVGVIDKDYHEEIKVPLWNTSSDWIKIQSGERIAQLVFLPVELPKFEIVRTLDKESVHSGFGSTGCL